MRKNTPLALAVSTTLGFAAAGLSTSVVAQELEEVMVTGTRLSTVDGFGQVAPVSVVSAEDIKMTGMAKLEDVLNSLPSIEASQNSYISNGATGTASLDLRGLGSNRTLVLFNGKRLQAGGVNTQSVDINQIPAAIVERVEVLTGGASATYGADAVAGVVNFITRKVNGIEISVGANGYQHKNDNKYIQGRMDARGFDYPTGSTDIDGRSYNLDVLMGSDFSDGRGNATVYATWRKGDPLLQSSRDYSNCALEKTRTGVTRCGGSATAEIPNFLMYGYDSAGDFIDYAYFTLTPDSGLESDPGWVNNRYNFAPTNYFLRPDEKYSIGAFVDYQVSDTATPYLEVNYTSSASRAQIAESGTFFGELYNFPVDYFLFPTNFQNSLLSYFGTDVDSVGVYIGKRNTEGGPRAEITDYDSLRLVGGVRGALTDSWDYDVYFLRGQTTSSSTYVNDVVFEKLRAALEPDCGDLATGCYQVFTFGGITSLQASGLGGTAVASADTSTEVISGYVSGDLGFSLPGADNIQAVFGFEHRMERYDRVTSDLYESGSLAGQGGPFLPLKGGYNVMEYFTEFSVPVIEGLTLDAAYRFSDYTTAGSTDTYRIGLDWQPIDMLRVRTGYNRAVRAPNVAELFSAEQLGLWGGVDPCSGSSPQYTLAECANTGVTVAQYGSISASPAQQYNQKFGGNQDLGAEKADTFTFGVVVTPIESLSLSVDYWSIKIEDAIQALGAPLILEVCAKSADPEICDLINRSPTGSLWLGQSGFVVNPLRNFGENTWEGIDFAASFRKDALGGSFSATLVGTYLLTKEVAPLATYKPATYDCTGLINSSPGCFPSPELRFVAGLSYDSNEWWGVGGRVRYIGEVEYSNPPDVIAPTEEKSEIYVDLNATFRFMENSDVVFGINNVLDEEPPLVNGTVSSNANTIAGFYDTLGRYLFMEATLRF